ncbi:MAG: N-acetyltransferase [Methyloceanibacter sp.]|uniref:GNAT family N-acetyltransferase n=1 Tax=Methyloceanibacter sp. TaxID=1965321 RepID=UPI001D8E3094|nr:N-acetyltransferase [Methyloceanibacter sp.]MCB1442524.1 N-acetyltransferase [Methyloceanibacter sp.]MCC0058156.1 N-acetyltransferase [Hyphomicrobiaceae bacterium]
MHIRTETPGDEDAIDRVTTLAFEAGSHSDHTEARIVRELRAAGDLTLSLVAEADGELVGHIAFSPVAVDGKHDGWYGLGPLSVRPDRQDHGFGSALVEQGLAILRDRGARGCALLGSPDFYARFGFASDRTLSYGSVPARFIQAVVFTGARPSGELSYASAFDLAGS